MKILNDRSQAEYAMKARTNKKNLFASGLPQFQIYILFSKAIQLEISGISHFRFHFITPTSIIMNKRKGQNFILSFASRIFKILGDKIIKGH